MKVRDLKRALAALAPMKDDLDFEIWLPGSTIYLAALNGGPPALFESRGKIMVEGNVTRDSTLDK